jgi:Ca2+-binding EF-hand superfamily protein
MGWFVFGYNVYFEQHLIQLRKVFATKDIFLLAQENGMDDEKFANETTYLKELEEHHNDGTNSLPAWCHVDLDKYIENRHWLVKWMVPGTPNRQQTLYWLDRKGPKFYMIVLQANLIFIGLYTAMNLLGFLKFMYHSQHPVTFIAYLVLSILPMIGVMFFKKHLVAILSQVCCMGAYRRPNIVADVLREEKTARVVRAFIIIYKLRRFAEQAGSKKRDKGAGQLYRAQFDQLELQEVGKTFDSFDRSGDGSISYDEFELLMTQLGASMSPDSLQRMIAMLDEDGDGEVSKNEFINWYAEYAGEEDMSPHERAKYLFSLFDSQGTGELTIGEFKRKLDALNVGFTVDDVGALVNELDEDNSGSIGLHEFEDLLNKYYPKELKQQQSTSSSVHESRSFH